MSLVLLFAFVSGFATALTPCVLPVLPIVLASTAQGGKSRPIGVIAGLIGSFTFFTLFLTAIVQRLGLPADLLRNLAIGALAGFGLIMLVPRVSIFFEMLTSRLQRRVGAKMDLKRDGFGSGLLVGAALGLLWTPCAGPILASVIALAVTSSVTIESVLITFAYISGSAMVLLAFVYGGRGVGNSTRFLRERSVLVQRVFGVVMLSMAVLMLGGWDRKFQEILVQSLPAWALTPLASLESSELVSKSLENLRGQESQSVSFDKARLLGDYGKAADFVGASEWINSDGLKMSELRGRVVLMDFWTYSCVNCVRTIPYLKQWHKRYEDSGLTIIGVHAPEFAFEREVRNVRRAVEDFAIDYPVVLDNDFEIWREYQGARGAWPAKYLVDAQGVIRFKHIGEGRYDETERAIQLLLSEVGQNVDYKIEKQELLSYRVKTPETYMGYARMDENRWRGLGEMSRDNYMRYKYAESLKRDEATLEGDWKITAEYAEAKQGSKIKMVFYSNEVNLVMSKIGDEQMTIEDGLENEVAVTDEEYIGRNVCTNELCIGGVDPAAKGAAVNVNVWNTNLVNTEDDLRQGKVFVNQAKLYGLVSLSSAQERVVELEFLEEGVRIYAWTF